MKKVLFVASITGHITAFHIPFLELLKKSGYEIEVAAKGEREIPFCDKHYEIGFERNPFKLANIAAYKKIKKTIKDGGYDLIHCHTPVAAFLTRMAARKVRKNGTKVIYTAHGFHFYKGAPFINWLVYFPVEWISSFLTDVLITINKEDFRFAKKYLHAKHVEYVPGVGVNTDKVDNAIVERDAKRSELGIGTGETVILSVGELNDNKNHEAAIRAIAQLKEENVTYLVCGKGGKKEFLEALARDLGVKLVLPGHRKDIGEILKCADIFVFPSKREGLPVSVMEAMAAGLACIVSKIRGNTDLIHDGKGGYLVNPHNIGDMADAMDKLIKDEQLRKEMGAYNICAVEPFILKNVIKQMQKIYLGE